MAGLGSRGGAVRLVTAATSLCSGGEKTLPGPSSSSSSFSPSLFWFATAHPISATGPLICLYIYEQLFCFVFFQFCFSKSPLFTASCLYQISIDKQLYFSACCFVPWTPVFSTQTIFFLNNFNFKIGPDN